MTGAQGTMLLEGIPGSAGYAIGPAQIVDTRRTGVIRTHIAAEAVDGELERFTNGVTTAARELREVAERAKSNATRAESSILEAYVLMVEDETVRHEVERRVREELLCAEWALDLTVGQMSARLRQSGDAYLAERSHDIEFVGDRILR